MLQEPWQRICIALHITIKNNMKKLLVSLFMIFVCMAYGQNSLRVTVSDEHYSYIEFDKDIEQTDILSIEGVEGTLSGNLLIIKATSKDLLNKPFFIQFFDTKKALVGRISFSSTYQDKYELKVSEWTGGTDNADDPNDAIDLGNSESYDSVTIEKTMKTIGVQKDKPTDIGVSMNSMLLTCSGIWNDEKYMYFRVKLKNKGKLSYFLNSALIRYYDGGVEVNSSEPLLYDAIAIVPKAEDEFYIIAPLFSISDKGKLVVTLGEKLGTRNIEFTIKGKSINK